MLSRVETDRLIKKAEEFRDREHRLKPSLRLKTQVEIINFVHNKGLVSALGGNELPSFINAVLGKAWKPSAKGFKGWLDWWSFKVEGQGVARVSAELERRNDIIATRIFRRSKTFVSNRLWPIIDPIVLHQRELGTREKTFTSLEVRILETIESEESIRTDRLRQKLRLQSKQDTSKFHRSLVNLESRALIVGAEDPHPESHLHANIWQTWDTRRRARPDTRLSYPEAVARLLENTLNACVIAEEEQVPKWFVWSGDTQAAKEDFIKNETIVRVGTSLLPSRIVHSLADGT